MRWTLGNRKLADKYGLDLYTYNIYDYRYRYRQHREILMTYHIPIWAKIIDLLRQNAMVYLGGEYIGFFFHFKIVRVSYAHFERHFSFYILHLDNEYLRRWKLFQASEFCLALPNDIVKEIFEYVYSHLIKITNYEIDYEYYVNEIGRYNDNIENNETLLIKYLSRVKYQFGLEEYMDEISVNNAIGKTESYGESSGHIRLIPIPDLVRVKCRKRFGPKK